MERRLILMRHAKSSWKYEGISDHERPLNDRGRKSAPAVAERLAALGWLPQAVYSSDATRTRETWECLAPAFPDVPVLFTSDLYLGGLEHIRQIAWTWSAELNTVLVLGHNPGCEEALHALSGSQAEMTTGNAALLVGHGDSWHQALHGRWRLAELLRPKGLTDEG